ncbi:M48 family metalloprotease [Nocardia sp. BMG51109]|uniref:M48 family metalloprotease n=1 Tax=Nocardia sp. BMG51109 TaxID=1056816 RepID=UPI00046490DF|nr:M48 family metalloprotease [Nocardia sp. BMG51109]
MSGLGERVRSADGERALGAGTTVRFALLAVLLVVVGGAMMFDSIALVLIPSDSECELAAGANPGAGTVQVLLTTQEQWRPYGECTARHDPRPPWWLPWLWPAMLPVGAGAAFFGIAARKGRRGRVVPLEEMDAGPRLRETLSDLVAVAGLRSAPRFVVDPTATSAGAVVFGRTRRATVCLHGGLVAARSARPERFRAVVLHELAHIRNGDITLTYATVAMWRVFLVAVLAPYTVLHIAALAQPNLAPGETPALVRNLALAVFLVLLVYLARSDVLRSREIYADLAAVQWGADPRGWVLPDREAPTGTVAWAWGSFLELWRTHPRWELRRGAIAEPAVTFGVQGLPFLLTGATASLISARLELFSRGATVDEWARQAMAFIPAALVTAVAGFALARAVAFANRTDRTPPSGVTAGLWLGTGLVAGELVSNGITVFEWLPRRPWMLLLVLAAGTVYAWWIAQCTALWVRAWPGRRLRPIVLSVLAAACLMSACWFLWWGQGGRGLYTLTGLSIDPAGAQQIMLPEAEPVAAAHAAEWAATGPIYAVLLPLNDMPLAALAVALFSILPLLAWVVKPAATPAPSAPAPLPPIRPVWRSALAGGAAGLVAMVAVQAYMHSWQPAIGGEFAGYILIYLLWILAALMLAMVVAAVAAGIRPGPYHLVATVIAAQTALALGVAACWALMAVDGCVRPLNTLGRSCGRSGSITSMVLSGLLPVAIVGSGCAALVAAATLVVHRRRSRRGQDTNRVRVRPIGALAGRLWLVAATAAAAGLVAASAANAGDVSGDDDPAQATALLRDADRQAVSADVARRQMGAWRHMGGDELWQRVRRFAERLVVLENTLADPSGNTDIAEIGSTCGELDRIVTDAQAYFRIPDPSAQAHWQLFIDRGRTASAACGQAVHDLAEPRQQDAGPQRSEDPAARLVDSLDMINGAMDEFVQTLRSVRTVPDP